MFRCPTVRPQGGVVPLAGQEKQAAHPVFTGRAAVQYGPGLPPSVEKGGGLSNAQLQVLHPSTGAQAFGFSQQVGAGQQGTGQQTFTGTCLHTTLGTQRVTV